VAPHLYTWLLSVHTMLWLKQLCANGADLHKPNIRGQTPLAVAAFNGHGKVMLPLFSWDAIVDAATNNGSTPLFLVAEKGHGKVAHLLCGNDADVNKASNSGATLVFIAARSGHASVVHLLCANGANVDKATNRRVSLLIVGADYGHGAVVGAKRVPISRLPGGRRRHWLGH